MEYKDVVKKMKADLKQIGAEIKTGRIEMKALFRDGKDDTGGGLMSYLLGQSDRARHLQLVYGMIRERAYHNIEQKVRENNEPKGYFMYSLLRSYDPDLFSKEDIEKWLKK